MAFELWPAIDLRKKERGSAAVRLVHGLPENETIYAYDLEGLAKKFSEFAAGIHVVDLDGAFKGSVQQFDAIQRIVEASSVPVEVGGGVRTIEEIEKLIKLRVRRVILGTSAVVDPKFLQDAINNFPADQLVFGADIKNGFLATKGWTETSQFTIEEYLTQLKEISKIRTVIMTDVSRDGTLEGPSMELYDRVLQAHPDISLIASGGVGSIDDLEKLRAHGRIAGAVFGKAYFDGKITDEQLIRFSQE